MSSSNKLLLEYTLRNPVWVVLTIILGLSGALFNGISTLLLVPLLLAFLGQTVNLEGAPPVIEKVMLVFDGFPLERRLALMTGIILIAIILKNAATYASSLASSYLSRALVRDIRLAGIQLLLDVDLDFYSKTKIGDLLNCIGQEVNRTANAIRTGTRIVMTGITILVFVALLIAISWELTFASTFLLLIIPLVNQYFVKRAKKFGQTLSEKSRAYSSALIEILNGIRLVKSNSHEDKEYERLEYLIHEREKAEIQSQLNFALIGPVNEIAGIIALLTIVILGRTFFAEKIEVLSAVLLNYLIVLFRLLPQLSQLNTNRSELANFLPSTAVVADFLERRNKPFMASGKDSYTQLKRGIRFQGVSFAYPGHKELVLNNINVWLPRGTTLALVGTSGAGKSTLADLLPRFYDPTTGKITIDGKDLRDYDVRSLRKAMGIVSQDTFLFNDSVRNNIAYGRPDASDAEIIQASKRANAYEFIINLPQGFDTPLGDRGILLSGGQRQRIAIARALLSNPEILILDEATSALDTVSERLVQQALEELSRDRTTLVIAHRLSTIQKADQIAVLEKGEIVELGNHEELLHKGGYYSRLYSMQLSQGSQDAIKNARNETLFSTSYELRTRLNPMIGFLRLIVDDVVDSPEERRELTDEAYASALRLLTTLEYLESTAKDQMKLPRNLETDPTESPNGH